MTALKAPLFAACAAMLLINASSQTQNYDGRRAAVVKLQCHFANRGEEVAAGMLVGKDQQNAYFITVRHALIDDSGAQPVAADLVKLRFASSANSVVAQLFDHSDPSLDLGVVYIPLANLPPNIPLVPQSDAALSSPVVIIGHPPAGDWSVWQGEVENENAPEGDIHHFVTTTNPSLAKGFSGGPEFDPSGNFLGMQVAYVATYGIAAKRSEIVALLRAWRVPTNNMSDKRGGASDIDAINAVLHSYEEAYNHLDSSALWQIWPGAPSKTKQTIEHYFADADSIRVRLQMRHPEISTNFVEAKVKGRLSQQFTPRMGTPPPPRDDEISFSLKKAAGVWMIVDVQ